MGAFADYDVADRQRLQHEYLLELQCRYQPPRRPPAADSRNMSPVRPKLPCHPDGQITVEVNDGSGNVGRIVYSSADSPSRVARQYGDSVGLTERQDMPLE